jgi:drug/metabolite transporter (DMT)-like permease
MASGSVSLLCLPFVAVPTGAIWYWIAISAVLHTLYKLFLVRAYAAGELGQVYPLARGAAPLIVAAVSMGIIGADLGTAGVIGILVLVSGIWLMSLRGGQQLRNLDRQAVFFAIGTSCFIAGYTLVDGYGARRAASASSYVLYLFVLDALLMFTICAARRGTSGFRSMQRVWKGGVAGGAMSLGAYWIATWAMTVAPIPAVAALRETSVLFAVAISTIVLKERLTLWRLGAALLIVAGVTLVRL